MFPSTLRRRLPYVFILITFVCYICGYFIFALDRSIFSWIRIIHYLNPGLIVSFVFASAVVAYYLSKVRLSGRVHPLALIVIALFCTILFFGLPQFNPDSAVYYAAANHLKKFGLINGLSTLRLVGYASLPGYPLLLSLLPDGYFPVQCMHSLIFICIPVFVFLIGRRLWNPQVGFFGGLLSLSTPIMLSNHYFMLPDVPMTFFLLVSVYAALKMADDKRWLIIFLPAALLTVSMKVMGLLYLVSVLLPLVAIRFWSSSHNKRFYMKIGVVSVVLFLASVVVIYSFPSLKERVTLKIHSLDPYDNLMRFLSIGSQDPSSTLFYQVGFPQSLLFLAFIYFSLKHKDRRNLILYSWILLSFIAAHDTRTRYLLPFFPAVSLAASNALQYIQDERSRHVILYFSCCMMLLVTLTTVPQIASEYTIRNLQSQAQAANALPGSTLGVYAYSEPIMDRDLHFLAAMSDYYASKDVIFLGFNYQDYQNDGWWRTMDPLLNATYPSLHYTPNDIALLLAGNYSKVSESTGGSLKYYDTYYVTLFKRRDGRGGPTDLILYLSNINVFDDELTNKSNLCSSYIYSLYCLRNDIVYTQEYSFGPVKLAGTYEIRSDSWLGENMLFMKPPNVGQINQTYSLFIPENSTLKFSVSLAPDTWHTLKGNGVEFIVLAGEKGTNTDYETLFDRYIDPKNNVADRKLFKEQVDLRRYWGKDIELVLQTKSGPNNNSIYDTAGWGNPRIVMQ